jgi:hypothetical protein
MLQKSTFTITPLRILSLMLFAVLLICWQLQIFGQNKSSTKGFEKIFDGKTLNNWEGDSTYWRVENGNLVGEIHLLHF